MGRDGGEGMMRIAVTRLSSKRFPVPQRQYWCKIDDGLDAESFDYTAINMQEAAERFMARMHCRGTRPEEARVLVSPDDRRWFWRMVMLQPKPGPAVTR